MKNPDTLGFVAMCENEAIAYRGGVDKQAQDALYMIGYALGVIVKLFVSLFTLFKMLFD